MQEYLACACVHYVNTEELYDILQEYLECACVHGVNSSQVAARDGICSQEFCIALPIFIVLFFFTMLFIFMCEGMNITPVVRLAAFHNLIPMA